MRRLLWLLLAALPMTATAQADDPIAYKCYYCTPAEMEDVALLQGVGQHYVYDVSGLHIVGFNVALQGGILVADPFPAEEWVKKQFIGFVQLYGHHLGGRSLEPLGSFEEVYLYAPGSDHARVSQYLSSEHFSALHPDHRAARQTVARFLASHPVLGFLDTEASGGRLLRLELNKDGDRPPIATTGFSGRHFARFFYDYSARRWEYLAAHDGLYGVQEKADDFVVDGQPTTFNYRWLDSGERDAFMKRAARAGVSMIGTPVLYKDAMFLCERAEEGVRCTVN
ncbi:hypothetical protein [Stenotrophomonas sp. AB1(2024)]|uniref:hypothetical protein n=1 Tax=Stenotrophomonas sp. AB1(2024) TaxID=3132215 RepID=UPI003094F6BA